MKWLREILGLDTQQEDLKEVKSSLNTSIALFKKSLVEIESVKGISVQNEKRLIEIEEIKEKRNGELNNLKKEVGQVLEILSPKPVPIDFKLVDPLDNKVELFSFHQLMKSNPDQEKIKVKNSNPILSNIVGLVRDREQQLCKMAGLSHMAHIY